MIVNEREIPIIGTELEYKNYWFIFPWKKHLFFPKENTYIVCLSVVTTLDNIDLSNIIPVHHLNKIISGELRLVIVNLFEGHILTINLIYDYFVIKNNIHESRIYFITEGYGLENHVARIASEKNKLIIKTFWSLIFEISVSYRIRKYEPNYNKKITHKKFIMFNKRWRKHRPLFVALLKINDLLDYGYVSLVENISTRETHSWDHFFSNFLNKDNLFYPLLNKNKNKIYKIKNLVVDTQDVHNNNLVAPFNVMSEQFYCSSFFSIVAETYFYKEENAGLCLTEKIFKPMAFYHPFIVLAKPKTIALLKSIGYRTFHPFINEEYDNEIDDDTRMFMVLQEVKRLCNLNIDEMNIFIQNTISICRHNFNLLKSKNNLTSKQPFIPLN